MKISVVIPTLAADDALAACLASLRAQSFMDFETIVADNSGKGAAVSRFAGEARVIDCGGNLGYCGGVNRGIRESTGEWVLALNDDTTLAPDCLERMYKAASARREIGMCAPRIMLAADRVDSAGGLLMAPDGSSKQRGHGQAPEKFAKDAEVLLPSGCAALYRREMLDEIGLFEESYFLYCEDTDLGLRARRQAWECVYAAGATVHHRYSHSAGKTGKSAVALKAYYVERNRLWTVVRNFPLRELSAAPWHTLERYWWHWRLRGEGKGIAADFEGGSHELAFAALRAWKDTLSHLPTLLKQRREIRKNTRLNDKQFARLLSSYRIGGKQVAEL